ncbi:MAG: hypothetical protein WD738_24135 [Pirellulales bacterium]
MANRDNTAKLAKDLWSVEALEMEPAEFQTRFDAIYASAEGIATYWHLGGAANDYLQHHPNSITVPPELAPRLLASRMVDGRIIGLKLLNRCSSDLNLIATWICRALQSKKKKTELYGGLCELSDLLPRLTTLANIPVDELRGILQKLRSSGDIYVRDWADRFIDWIECIEAKGYESRRSRSTSLNTESRFELTPRDARLADDGPQSPRP